MQQNNSNHSTQESFGELFKQMSAVRSLVDHVVKGVVIFVEKNHIIVDVGLKSEGRISISEFADEQGNKPTFEPGNEVEVYIERYEDVHGSIILSREKAKREEIWRDLGIKCQQNENVTGYVVKKVKGGFSVLINNTQAFLPGSQLDNRQMKNPNSLLGTNQTLSILKMDKKRFNIVVSRKAVAGNSDNDEPEVQYNEGDVVEGTVKNITGYGAFIDLGSRDALLHLTDLSWSRINHPTEVLQLNQVLKLKVIKIHPDTQRISLGLKQLADDPWKEIETKYQVGQVTEASITNLVDYGCFCEIEKGVEGLVHVSEISWVKKDVDPKRWFTQGSKVPVKIIEIDSKKRRVNLSMKQCIENPWIAYSKANPEGTALTALVKGKNDNGLIVQLNDELEGFIKAFDLSWDNKGKEKLDTYAVGDKVECKIIKYDLDKDKVLLSVKHLSEDPFASIEGIKKGVTVKATITSVLQDSLEVKIGDKGVTGYINQHDLAMEKSDQKTDNFNVGQEVEAIVTFVNSVKKVINLSIKAIELEAQKQLLSNNNQKNESESLREIFEKAMINKEQK